jgi:hypothetical protein
MIAGLCSQVLSLLVFLVLCLDYFLRLRSVARTKDERFADLTSSWTFRAFANYGAYCYASDFELYLTCIALWLATALVLIRSIYRIVELQAGFQGSIASNEVAFMVLEGPMIIGASLVLTVLHPGLVFQGNWRAANWTFREK